MFAAPPPEDQSLLLLLLLLLLLVFCFFSASSFFFFSRALFFSRFFCRVARCFARYASSPSFPRSALRCLAWPSLAFFWAVLFFSAAAFASFS